MVKIAEHQMKIADARKQLQKARQTEDIEENTDGFEIEPLDSEMEIGAEDDDGYYGDERERTNRAYNLDILDPDNLTNDFWQMPIIKNNGYIPNDLIGFNYAKTTKNKNAGVHFYLDDYQFERIWNYPEKYIDVLKEYDCILTPDFSLYMDMPMAMKIWNVYRSRQIGAYYQSMGFKKSAGNSRLLVSGMKGGLSENICTLYTPQ